MVVNRRDMLKILGTMPMATLLKTFGHRHEDISDEVSGVRNILILLFDTLSARHMSLYGYPRETTPNMDRFAARSYVYHRHYAAGNYTTPGTASLLTGTYPWTHRAFHIYGQVDHRVAGNNLFAVLDTEMLRRVAYTHNDLAEMLLFQFRPWINRHLRSEELALFTDTPISASVLDHDHNLAFLGEKAALRARGAYPASILGSIIAKVWRTKRKDDINSLHKESYPGGLPTLPGASLMFLLEDGIDYIMDLLQQSEAPFVGYFHFYPPHGPYHNHRDFNGLFDDGWRPKAKPKHHFDQGVEQGRLDAQRLEYDRYIAYTDWQFGRLFDFMQDGGFLEDTLVVLTSDHGQLFERGILGHTTPVLYEPIVQIPLIISVPGDRRRLDINGATSCVDILPTLSAVIRGTAPSWSEGQILPGFPGGRAGEDRAVYAVEAKENKANKPLQVATVSLWRGDHKLVHYFGYPGFEEEYELYDLRQDSRELMNMYSSLPGIAHNLRELMHERLQAQNERYLARAAG